VNRNDFQTWLDRYIEAWRSGDAEAIGDLFSQNAQYYHGPYRDPVRGRDAIVRDWNADPDAPGSWEAEYRPLAVDGDTAVATGESRYRSDGSQEFDLAYSNIFLCRFDQDGRCREFREWFVKRPAKVPAGA
jgi:ketosteroid isomerase-like protein